MKAGEGGAGKPGEGLGKDQGQAREASGRAGGAWRGVLQLGVEE